MSDLPNRDDLLRAQPHDPMFADRYHASIEQLRRRHYSSGYRWVASLLALAEAAAGVGLFFPPANLAASQSLRTYLFVNAVGCLIFAGIFGFIALRGQISRQVMNNIFLAAALFICGGGGLVFLDLAFQSEDASTRYQFILAGTTLLLIAAGSTVMAVLQDFHYKTLEYILQLQCDVADLKSALASPSPRKV